MLISKEFMVTKGLLGGFQGMILVLVTTTVALQRSTKTHNKWQEFTTHPYGSGLTPVGPAFAVWLVVSAAPGKQRLPLRQRTPKRSRLIKGTYHLPYPDSVFL